LSAAQCCALDASHIKLIAVEPTEDVLEALYAARRGEIEAATKLCVGLLEDSPSLLPALHLLFLIRRDQGQREAALVLARRLARLAPKDAGIACELTRVLSLARHWDEADAQARHALRLAPNSVEAHELLARVFHERKDFTATAYQLRRAIANSDEWRPALLLELAQALLHQGALDEARDVVRQVLEKRPEHVPALLQMAQIEEYADNDEVALALLAQVAAHAPGLVALNEAQARLAFNAGDAERTVAFLSPMENATDRGVSAVLLKGRALDRLGKYDDAFSAFETAQMIDYDEAEAKRHLGWIENTARHAKAFFTRSMMDSLPRAASPSIGKKPIFIAGFARSGTTLVEQSLSMHPDVCAGGELQSLRTVLRSAQRLLDSKLPYPNALTELWMGDRRNGLNLLRDAYLADAAHAHGVAGSDGKFFTDKMIFNEMHLALIALILPQAPVIHMIRHPLDVVLSVFSHQLSGGMRSRFKLEDIARHYAILIDVVEHYKREGCAGRYLAVRYEELVHDQPTEMARLLEFVGLGFDEACLNFSKNPRYARTLSFSQVRRELNLDGVFRYRHYRRHLAPIYPILAPCIEKLGYDID
jgi:tetratricopeptide (TPR) repeat protein